MSWAAVVIEDRRVHAPLPRPGQGSRSGRGCDHFRTDISHLPDLTGYLVDLPRTRERLAAAVEGVDEWARADATPAAEEITRIRRLISKIKGDITQLVDAERAVADDAVAVVRRHRSARSPVSLGMPTFRTPLPLDPNGVPRMSTRPATANHQPAWPASPRTGAMTKGRQADSARRRQRVIAALNKAASDGTEISVSGIARERGEELAAARATNRELMTQFNHANRAL